MTPTLGFLGWIIIGGLAGWIGSKIQNRDAQMGIGLNILVGIIGGLLGGWLLSAFGVDVAGGGLFFSFLTCLLGAVILLWIINMVTSSCAPSAAPANARTGPSRVIDFVTSTSGYFSISSSRYRPSSWVFSDCTACQ